MMDRVWLNTDSIQSDPKWQSGLQGSLQGSAADRHLQGHGSQEQLLAPQPDMPVCITTEECTLQNILTNVASSYSMGQYNTDQTHWAFVGFALGQVFVVPNRSTQGQCS